MTLTVQMDVERGAAPLKDWQIEAGQALLRTLRPPSAFPCVFSQAACKRGRILFAFVDGLDPAALDGAADDLIA